MTYLRHAARHIHHTVADHIETRLDSLGWTSAAATPFGATPVSVKRTAGHAKDITAGQVRISLGDEYMPQEQEMGGPLTRQDVPLFVDIFMDREAIALALACDVRDICLGRLGGGTRFLPVINQVNDTAVPGWQIELDDVIRVRPDHALPLSWQVVKVTASTYFPEGP